jgi:hypothetical protein
LPPPQAIARTINAKTSERARIIMFFLSSGRDAWSGVPSSAVSVGCLMT